MRIGAVGTSKASQFEVGVGRPPSIKEDSPLFGKQAKKLPTLLGELKQLTVAYAKQETVDPLKGLARYIGAGIAGSVALGIGLVLLVLAALRALQTETGSAFTGHLTWVPYLITFVLCLFVILLALRAISADKRAADKRKAARVNAVPTGSRGEGK